MWEGSREEEVFPGSGKKLTRFTAEEEKKISDVIVWSACFMPKSDPRSSRFRRDVSHCLCFIEMRGNGVVLLRLGFARM